VKAVIVLTANSFDPFQPNTVRAFPETPEGNEQAEAYFRECVTETCHPDLAIEDVAGREEIIANALEEGVFPDHEGGIVIFHTTE